jgi:hypothetical protein
MDGCDAGLHLGMRDMTSGVREEKGALSPSEEKDFPLLNNTVLQMRGGTLQSRSGAPAWLTWSQFSVEDALSQIAETKYPEVLLHYRAQRMYLLCTCASTLRMRFPI